MPRAAAATSELAKRQRINGTAPSSPPPSSLSSDKDEELETLVWKVYRAHRDKAAKSTLLRGENVLEGEEGIRTSAVSVVERALRAPVDVLTNL
jgi:hypothetical protein